MPYEHIHACSKGCVLFRKEHEHAKFCPKCKSSRYLEVDSDDGQKRQLTIPVKILRHLPFLPRIQRLYMTEESTKQMTWHKNDKRYNADKRASIDEMEKYKYSPLPKLAVGNQFNRNQEHRTQLSKSSDATLASDMAQML